MINIITLCNDAKWIDNIIDNITTNPSELCWNVYLNNCDSETIDQFRNSSLDTMANLVYLGNGESFSSLRAKAFLDAEGRSSNLSWFMNVDADDRVIFDPTFCHVINSMSADVIVQDSYVLEYPDQVKKVTVNVPKNLTEYCSSTEFLYTVQFIYSNWAVKQIYRPTDTNVSIWDEVIPQIRLYQSEPKIAVNSNLFTYYYKRGHETISNNPKYYTLMLNLLEVYRKAMSILDNPIHKELIANRFKTMNLNYILRKAGPEADNIKMLFDKITTEVDK